MHKFLKISGWGASLFEGCKIVPDWLGRFDIAHQIYALAWVKPVIQFLDAIPNWAGIIILIAGLSLIYLDSRIRNRSITPQSFSDAPEPLPAPLSEDVRSNAKESYALIPDWTIRELFNHLHSDVTNHKTKMWQRVGKEVRDKFSLGLLQSWGRELDSNRHRSALKKIDVEYWPHADFLYNFFTEDSQEMDHVRNEKGVSYADLRVNKRQVLESQWPEFPTDDKIFISLQSGTYDIFSRAKELNHLWYQLAQIIRDKPGIAHPEDVMINELAGVIAGKIPIYGKTPHSIVESE